MSEQTRPRPRGRPPKSPEPYEFIAAIRDGKFDDYINQISDAIESRDEARRERVNEMVREVYGEGFVVMPAPVRVGDEKRSEKSNPFLKRAKQSDVAPDTGAGEVSDSEGGGSAPDPIEPLPGPYKINPADGNAYRVEHIAISKDGPSEVRITDIFGGHAMTISDQEWDVWPSSEEEATGGPPDIERRGASISGLHPSDMGD